MQSISGEVGTPQIQDHRQSTRKLRTVQIIQRSKSDTIQIQETETKTELREQRMTKE